MQSPDSEFVGEAGLVGTFRAGPVRDTECTFMAALTIAPVTWLTRKMGTGRVAIEVPERSFYYMWHRFVCDA